MRCFYEKIILIVRGDFCARRFKFQTNLITLLIILMNFDGCRKLIFGFLIGINSVSIKSV